MNRTAASLLGMVCGVTASSHSIAAASSGTNPPYNQSILVEIETLYGMDKETAIARLAAEYDAAVQERRIEELDLPGYAGAWFDSTTLRLHVATNSADDFAIIKQIGAVPELVTHSLRVLEVARIGILDELTSVIGNGSVQKSYVDPAANAIFLGVSNDVIGLARAYIAARPHENAAVIVNSVIGNAEFSTNLLAADGTQNGTWHSIYGGTWPCSVGASAEEVNGSTYVAGFATAGHCNVATNTIESSDGTTLGTVARSTYAIVGGFGSFSYNEDGAWVETSAGWVPKPQVNGYTSGTLNVSGTWAGTLAAPVGTTVCRYGATSGGPHCAELTARNVSVYVGGHLFNGMIEVDGICTDDGDSGGPLVTPTNQVQGTVTGGTGNSCPDSPGDYVYFQPITTTLARASGVSSPVAMLTSHGRSAPTISAYLCPDTSRSGAFTYWCDYSSFDSQGLTTTSWTSNTGASSAGSILHDACNVGHHTSANESLRHDVQIQFVHMSRLRALIWANPYFSPRRVAGCFEGVPWLVISTEARAGVRTVAAIAAQRWTLKASSWSGPEVSPKIQQ